MNKVILFYGGVSCEHSVSCVSALFIEKNLHLIECEVYPIYISVNGSWHLQHRVCSDPNGNEHNPCSLGVDKLGRAFILVTDRTIYFDIVFPIIHGTIGEDGSLQGLLECLGVPYVGCGVLASAICMNKYFAKTIWSTAGIPQVNYSKIDVFEWQNWPSRVLDSIVSNFQYPIFIKPFSMGSSIGVSKCNSKDEITMALYSAFEYDNQVLIEQGLDVRECEVSLLGNYPEYKVTSVGEIICHVDFYSYEAKYINSSDSTLKIPALNLTNDQIERIQYLAKTAFKAVQGDGFARVDFFLDKKNNEIYLNEINTLPGFTPNSMYPKLWGYDGLESAVLIREILDLAIKKFKAKSVLKKIH